MSYYNESIQLIILFTCVAILTILITSVKGVAIKYHEIYKRYCIYYEIWVETYDPIADTNHRELKLVVRKLPKFLNIFYKGGL